MTELVLRQTRIQAGVWEGVLTGLVGIPHLEALHLEQALAGVSVEAVGGTVGRWAVRVPIPAQMLAEGVQTFIIRDVQSGSKLAHFTIITGAAMDEDIRAEMDLLRAELDLLKRAFRRHCVETSV